MSTPAPGQQKVVVLKQQGCDKVRSEVLDKHFLIDMRRALLQQLSVIERHLNLQRRCRQCGSPDLFTK